MHIEHLLGQCGKMYTLFLILGLYGLICVKYQENVNYRYALDTLLGRHVSMKMIFQWINHYHADVWKYTTHHQF